MPTLRTRAGKGSDLTPTEADANFKRTVTQKVGDYQVLLSDNRSVIEGNDATTAFTITLPPVASADNAETEDFEVSCTNINAAAVTVAGSGAETIDGAASITLDQWDSVTVALDSAQTAWKVTSRVFGLVPPILGTEQASTSGTSIDFTGIPSWAKKITIMMVGVSTSGTSHPLFQLGTSSTAEEDGYLGMGASFSAAGNSIINYTDGFGVPFSLAANVIHGCLVVTLEDATNFTWVARGSLGASNAAGCGLIAGSKSLAAALDSVHITTVDGTDTFDAGAINIQYE